MTETKQAVSKDTWKGPGDRRRSPRLECLGNAQLRILDFESAHTVQVQGKILNLSLIGCCIEAERPVCLRVLDKLEVYFHLNGTPILVMGVARAIHSKTRIGIEFVDVSSRKEEQIRFIMNDLLETLKEKAKNKNKELDDDF